MSATKPLSKPKPKINEFATVLNVTSWYSLGVFLGAEHHELDEINRSYKDEGSIRCLIELYKCLEKKGGELLTWEAIATSCRQLKEHALADKIRSDFIVSVIHQQQSTDEAQPVHSVTEANEGAEVDLVEAEKIEKITSEFESLSIEYNDLLRNVKVAFTQVDLGEVQDLLKRQRGIPRLPPNEATAELIFDRVEEQCSLLNLCLLRVLVEKYIRNKSLLADVDGFISAVNTFKDSASMAALVQLIQQNRQQIATADGHQKIVQLKVREFWVEFTVKQFETLLNELFQTLYDKMTYISITKGCICFTWVIPDINTTELLPVLSLDLVRLIGVIYLRIGSEVIYNIEGEGCESIEAAMIQAIELKNIQAVELLLAVGCNPEVATYNGDNAVTNILNIRTIESKESSSSGSSHIQHVEAIVNPSSDPSSDHELEYSFHSEMKINKPHQKTIQLDFDRDIEEHSIHQESKQNDPQNVESPADIHSRAEVEIIPNLNRSIKELAVQMEQTSLTGPPSPRRQLSSSATLTQQSISLSDEDDEIIDENDEIRNLETSHESPLAVMHSWLSWAEVDDIVPDLVSRKTTHPYNPPSDADSAISGMTFEDEGINDTFSDNARTQQRRIRSMLLPSDRFSPSNIVTLKLNSDQGLEIANSLEYEGHIIVTEDYPSDYDKKIFCKGDRILQVGDKSIHGMSIVEFSEFFQSEASTGTIVKVIPSQQKALKRTFREQPPIDTVRSRINQFFSKTFGADHKITLSQSGKGYPIKMIGGKMVGIFISDIKVTTRRIFLGDEILELNGISTRGMSLYDANHIVQLSVGELNLLVVENRNRYSHVRELVEVDSIYLRSLVKQKPTTSHDMALQKGTLLRVVNIYGLPNYWVAWCIDETTGLETQFKRILPPSVAKRQFNCDAYERLERHDSTFPRPLCICGPNSDKVAQLVADKPRFTLCTSVADILEVCSKGSGHAVMSITESTELAILNVLRPIVLQTLSDCETLSEQAKYTKFSVDGYLNGSCSNMAEQAVEEVESLQSLPIWKSIGVI